MNNMIEKAIEKGELVLLLGAGASNGCKDKLNRPLLDGEGLAVALASEIGMPYVDEGLSTTYAAAKKILGNRLNPILEERYRHCKPSQSYLTLAQYPWARIYTLNIDDAFDNALTKNSPQSINIRHITDRIHDKKPFYDELDYIKLNGSSDKLEMAIIFSPQEYGKSSAGNMLWYEELADDFYKYTFLFVGTKLNEPLFYHHIERYRSRSGGIEGKSFVLTPSATEIVKASLETYNLTHISGTLEDFVQWLQSKFPKPMTPNDLALRNLPQLALLSSEFQKNKYIELFDKVLLVKRLYFSKTHGVTEPAGKIREFYRGFKPTWQDIVDAVPADLEIAQHLRDKIMKIQEGEKLLVVNGPAGSGKTTLLMQAALFLSDSQPELSVYYISEPVGNIDSIIKALEETNDKRYFLFVDKIDVMSDEIADVLKSAVIKKGIIVAAERQNIWSSRTEAKLGDFCKEPITVNLITERDAHNILEKLQKYGPWTRLSQMSKSERIKELVDKAKRQLLIGLLETTLGRGFEEIIENDYHNLTSPELRKVLILAGLGSVHRAYIPAQTMSRALAGIGIFEGPQTLSKKMLGIIHMEDNKIFARHPVYIRYLFENVVDIEDLAEAIKALLSAYAVYPSPVIKHVSKNDGFVYKSNINHKFLKVILRENHALILSIYSSFEKYFEQDGLFWLQYGLALRDFGDQATALEKLQTAYEAYPMIHTEHAR